MRRNSLARIKVNLPVVQIFATDGRIVVIIHMVVVATNVFFLRVARVHGRQ